MIAIPAIPAKRRPGADDLASTGEERVGADDRSRLQTDLTDDRVRRMIVETAAWTPAAGASTLAQIERVRDA
jgi:hypothetical protein